MGFLSKLFGGDTGSASAKADAVEASAPTSSAAREQASAHAAPAVPVKPEAAQKPAHEAAPPSAKSAALPPEPPPAAKVAAEKAPEKPAPKLDKVAGAKPPAAKAPGSVGKAGAEKAAAAKPAGDKVPPSKLGPIKPPASPKAAEKVAATPASSADPVPPSASLESADKEVAAHRRAPERRRQLEESILTSAPKQPLDPLAHSGPARTAGKLAPSPSAPEIAREAPKSERASMSSLEAANLAAFRLRRDRSKSPGFYSSVSPANGSHAVSQPNLLKSTVVGFAPPPEPPHGAGDVGAAEPASGVAALLDAGEIDAALSAVVGESPLDASAPPHVSIASDEKEETSPGLGNNRSRHDPVVATPLPVKDLDLLVEFVLALAMGSSSEAWLSPIRGAVVALRTAATRAERTGLERALAQFAKEIEEPGALSDERRARILKQFASVDMALPRPIDVASRKAQRERLIVDQLMQEMALIHPLIPQRIREEGVASMERLARANVDELAQRVSTKRDHAEQIAATLQAYLSARAERGPELVILGKARVIRERLKALEASAEDFQRVSDGEDPEARRNARRKRQAEVAQVSLLLAQFGEASILSEIERCSVQGKIERIGRWLTELEAS